MTMESLSLLASVELILVKEKYYNQNIFLQLTGVTVPLANHTTRQVRGLHGINGT